MRFVQSDIFKPGEAQWPKEHWDILVSNPPYISLEGFNKFTARSVRNYEPKSALVPLFKKEGERREHDAALGDLFYPQLLKIAQNVQSDVLLLEVADMAQASRVVSMILEDVKWQSCEIWRDWPAQKNTSGTNFELVNGRQIRVRGRGQGRAVFAWTAAGRDLTRTKSQ